MPTRRTLLISALATPLASALRAGDAPIKLRDLYQRRGNDVSELAGELEGRRIRVEGYMAPPLKAESTFFVLTRRPMATCPFCETEAQWPNDILAVYTRRVVDVVPFNVMIETSGVLELGAYKDPDTGFLSMVRLTGATFG